ncbi:MAG: hypothetical protein HQL63_06590 [Magnetococcales bacterium]|nr:hypothetical protein [Magnetococcales bacterium]MBF0321832.1 hypothetical protein [Magnetococcales bacterium]
MFSVTLPDEMELRLKAMANKSGQTLEDYLLMVFHHLLTEADTAQQTADTAQQTVEDAEDSRLIRERLEIWERQGRPGISLEDYARSRGIGPVG